MTETIQKPRTKTGQKVKQTQAVTKIKKGTLCSLLADIINKKAIAAGYPPFSRTFLISEPEFGRKKILEEFADELVKYIPEDVVTDAILKYCRDLLTPFGEHFDIDHSMATSATKYWLSATDAIDFLPAAISTKSKKGRTFHRWPFDPEPCPDLKECPTWFEFQERCSNFCALAMRIASISDPQADRKQAIYLHGVGDTGKSEIQRCLGYLCGAETESGGAYSSVSVDDLKSPHWKTVLLGKRVLVVGEASNIFLHTEAFKALTGDERHSINPKGESIFHAKIDVLVFFISNDPPLTKNEYASILRLIDCEIKPFDKSLIIPSSEYQARLRSELPKFIGYCQHLYAHLAGGKRIPCDTSALTTRIDTEDAEALALFDEYFLNTEGASEPCSQVYSWLRVNYSPHQYGKMLKVWDRRLGVTRKRTSMAPRPWVFLNIRFKPGMGPGRASDSIPF